MVAVTTDFGLDALVSSTSKALLAVACGVTASAAKDCGVDVLASFALAALVAGFATVGAGVLSAFTLAKAVEAFVGVGAGLEPCATGLSARPFLASFVELSGAFLGVAGAESSAALLIPVGLLLFLIVNFAEFIFKFT